MLLFCQRAEGSLLLPEHPQQHWEPSQMTGEELSKGKQLEVALCALLYFIQSQKVEEHTAEPEAYKLFEKKIFAYYTTTWVTF